MQILAQLKQMSPERFLAIYQGLEMKGRGPLDDQVAASLRFRPQAITKLPIAQRAKRARWLVESTHNKELAYELFGAYLIKNHKELVTSFLDKTGVPHKDGMIEDIEKGVPAADKIESTIDELDGSFAPEDVTLYLSLCAEMWPTVPKLRELWEKRSK
jgi:hypothetical protein